MNSRNESFRHNSGGTEALNEWWAKLQEKTGDRAQLRRCRQLDEAVFCTAFHRLRKSLPQGLNVSPSLLAGIAIVASRVKENHTNQSFATQLASPATGSSSPRFSEMRFRRLLKHETAESLVPEMVRALALMGGKANLNDIAASLQWWNQNTRRRWAFDYYDVLTPIGKKGGNVR